MSVLQVNPCSLAYLLAAGVLGLLYYSLSRARTMHPARIAYNRSILAAVFWMFFDFLEYSSADPLLARAFLILTTLSIAVTLYFVLNAGFLLAGKRLGWIAYVPIIASVILSPFFEVQPAVFTPFDDKFNVPLGVWLGLEFVLFVAFPVALYTVRRKCSDERVIKRLDSLIAAAVFITIFTITYYVYHLFTLLPPLTWVMAIAYAGLTYNSFR